MSQESHRRVTGESQESHRRVTGESQETNAIHSSKTAFSVDFGDFLPQATGIPEVDVRMFLASSQRTWFGKV
jgi:hypothetical protein